MPEPVLKQGRRSVLAQLLLGWLLGCALAWMATAARADDEPRVTLERSTDGLYLSARVPLRLSPELEDVMLRGVPLHFVWQADWRRTRWYWTDQRLGSATRVVRLAYQPLTRRWRVSLGVGPLNEQGLANALHQNFESLDDALATVSRVTRWRLLSAAEGGDTLPDKVDLQFRLDAGLLPRLFQIGQSGDGSVWLRRTLNVPDSVAPAAPEPVGHAGREGPGS